MCEDITIVESRFIRFDEREEYEANGWIICPLGGGMLYAVRRKEEDA